MLFIDFLQWWYGVGWVLRFRMLVEHIENQLDYFSVGILLKTFFAPWRQNITGNRPDQGINGIFGAIIDNSISRLVGATVRFFALIAAVVTVFIVLILNIIYVVVWPFLPILPIILVIAGISNES